MHGAAWLALLGCVACGSRSELDDGADGAPDADVADIAITDAHDAEASVPLPKRTCSAPGEWAIPIGPSLSGVELEGSNIDIGPTGLIVATVAGWPPQDHCHSGPTLGSGGCAVLVIDATSDIHMERRFACHENWNVGRTAFAISDGGFVLSANIPKGSDVGSGALASDSLVIARFGADGMPIYVHVLPIQQTSLSASARPSGDVVVMYAKVHDTFAIERLDAGGAIVASRTLSAQTADNLDVRVATLDDGETAIAANTIWPVDWGDGKPDVSALVILDASLATARILHTHDVIQFEALKANPGGGFSYSGDSTSCALDLGSGPLGCAASGANVFAARFTDPSTLAFARKLPCDYGLSSGSCVDAIEAYGLIGRADYACTVAGKSLKGGFFAAFGPTGDIAGATTLPYFPRAIGCDSPPTRVIGGTLEHVTNVGPATLPVGGFVLRTNVSSLLQ